MISEASGGSTYKTIYVASDHAGSELKRHLIGRFPFLPWKDLGTMNGDSVDYPDYAAKLCKELEPHLKDSIGVLVCGSGQGMAIRANRFPFIRAALCMSEEMAKLARQHNDANVLCLGGRLTVFPIAERILDVFVKTPFEGGRHQGRVDKLSFLGRTSPMYIEKQDPEIAKYIALETERQEYGLEMIASENYASKAVMEAQGTILTNKYAEGYPHKRYYGGCEFVDEIEQLAIDRAKQLFGCEHANVQPHSGSQANMAVYLASVKAGDTIMGMDLAHGGHLTHGSPVNFSGFLFKATHYGLDPKTGRLNYDQIRDTAKAAKPKLLIAGYSAYPRVLDFALFRQIADEVGATLLVDMAHFAGLVAGGQHPSPVPFADYVTTTTHKTLRGPRGGMILCNTERAKALNSKIFPGIQGGPLEHVIAAKAISFGEALKPDFKTYAQQVVKNAQALAKGVLAEGFELVTGGTDNHLILLDLSNKEITGKDAEIALDKAGITVNKNTVPNEKRSPFVTSGVRIGTPALTTRGMKEADMTLIATWIGEVLKDHANEGKLAKIKGQVRELAKKYPIYRQ